MRFLKRLMKKPLPPAILVLLTMSAHTALHLAPRHGGRPFFTLPAPAQP